MKVYSNADQLALMSDQKDPKQKADYNETQWAVAQAIDFLALVSIN